MAETDDAHFRLRVPPGLHARIAEAAKAAGRSMNAEIVTRLLESFEPHPMVLPELGERVLREIEAWSNSRNAELEEWRKERERWAALRGQGG